MSSNTPLRCMVPYFNSGTRAVWIDPACGVPDVLTLPVHVLEQAACEVPGVAAAVAVPLRSFLGRTFRREQLALLVVPDPSHIVRGQHDGGGGRPVVPAATLQQVRAAVARTSGLVASLVMPVNADDLPRTSVRQACAAPVPLRVCKDVDPPLGVALGGHRDQIGKVQHAALRFDIEAGAWDERLHQWLYVRQDCAALPFLDLTRHLSL